MQKTLLVGAPVFEADAEQGQAEAMIQNLIKETKAAGSRSLLSLSFQLFLCFAMLAIGGTAVAAPVSQQQVQSALNNWLSSRRAEPGIRSLPSLRSLAWQAEQPVFYMADLPEGGWVLMGGDDLTGAVLGWSDSPAESETLPDALAGWLQLAEQKVLELREQGAQSAQAAAAWQAMLNPEAGPSRGDVSTESEDDVAPLLEGRWSQGSPWNSSCPADAAGPGGHAKVGCVAMSLAQVLDYWNWPEQGTGSQYYDPDLYDPIRLDFAGTIFDWDSIDPVIHSTQASDLLYQAGVAVRMNYGPGSSGAQPGNLVYALEVFLRYNPVTVRMAYRRNYSTEAWEALMRSELQAGRPVIYGGNGVGGGHEFNVDGVQDQTWFHINWGWGGSFNGWFSLSDLTPGNEDFNGSQDAVIGIEPDVRPANYPPVVAAYSFQIAEDDVLRAELNARDLDSDTLTYKVDGVNISGSTWEWTPPAGATGTHLFGLQVCDSLACSSEVALEVSVQDVNHAPVVTPLEISVQAGQSISTELSAVDADGDAVTFKLDGVSLETALWSWDASREAAGAYTFLYQACDALVCGEEAEIRVAVEPQPVESPSPTPTFEPAPTVIPTVLPEPEQTPVPDVEPSPEPEDDFQNSLPALKVQLKKGTLAAQCSLAGAQKYQVRMRGASKRWASRQSGDGRLSRRYRSGEKIRLNCVARRMSAEGWISSQTLSRTLNARELKHIKAGRKWFWVA